MGFDIECVINIHTYPGEYFCPLCRTLVYPNEALQSQCSHLYCKPCLAHIAKGIKACPYDGFLVTESDSKPLLVSDATLAEKIGKVKVRCLYFNSGCTWEGTLSDSTRHCSECAFGSSAVICNRCGVQIAHRQVYEHVQSCTGVYEAQRAVSVRFQDNLLHVHGQPQSQAYTHPPAQTQHTTPVPAQPQLQSYHVPQQQPQFQPMPRSGQAQSQRPALSPIPMGVQVPFQGRPQLHANNQPFQVNPQKQPPHVMCPQGQIPPQIPLLPLHNQSNQLPLSVPTVSMQPQARPIPLDQPTVPVVQKQHPHHPASGIHRHQTYQQLQPAHQVPQQLAMMPPPLSHDSFPLLPPSAFSLPQSQVSGAPPTQFSAHAQPPSHLPQHSVVLQPVHQAVPQQVSQHQLQQRGDFQQQPPQPQLHPFGAAVVHTVPAQYGSTRPPGNSNPFESALLEDDYFSRKYGNPVARVAEMEVVDAISIEASKGDSHPVADSNLRQRMQDLESPKEAVVAGMSTYNEKVSKNPFSTAEAHVKEQHRLTPRPQGVGISLHPGQSCAVPVRLSCTERAHGYFGHPPGSFETYFRPNEGVMLKNHSTSHLSGSVERVPHRQIFGHEPSTWRTNVEADREYLNRFPSEPFQPLDQGSMTVHKSQPGSSYGTGGKLNPGLDPNSRLLPPYHASGVQGHADVIGPSPESGRDHAKHFLPRSADREYLGVSHEFGGPSRFPRGTAAFDDVNAREAQRFGEGSSSFKVPSDPAGNPFHDSRFPPMPDHPRRGRGDSGSQHNLRFGEHMFRPPHSHIKSDESFGKDGRGPVPVGIVNFSGPGHFMPEAAGPGVFSGHSHAGELAGPGDLNHPIPSSIPPLGEPGIRGSNPLQPLQGLPNPGLGGFAGEVGSSDQSRNRKPNSMSWCRICLFDCETVEGLEMHSETEEHQKLAMDLVKTMKERNRNKQRTSAGPMGYDGESGSKKEDTDGHGNRP